MEALQLVSLASPHYLADMFGAFQGNAENQRLVSSQPLTRIPNAIEKQHLGEENIHRGLENVFNDSKPSKSAVSLQLQLDSDDRQSIRYEHYSDDHVVASLSDCAKLKDLANGRKLHAELLRAAFLNNNVVISNALLKMYTKCGALEKAQKLLDDIPNPNLVSWNTLITGYTKQGRGKEALECYDEMLREGLSPNATTFTCALKACGNVGATQKGQDIHQEIVRGKVFEKHCFVGNALVDMYARWGALNKAQKVFDELPLQDVVSWNILIAGYIRHGHNEKALDLFNQMRIRQVSPNPVTYVYMLQICGNLQDLEKGQSFHAQIDNMQLMENNVIVANAVVDMYAKCGALDQAQETFAKFPNRNVIMWNTLIGGFIQHGHGEKALDCFDRMLQEKFEPDVTTFASALKACASVQAMKRGQEIHEQVAKLGFIKGYIQVGTALLDMYAKFGDLEKAQKLFDELPVPNLVSWNALLTGYVHQAEGEKALGCFECLQESGFCPDVTSFAGALKACGTIGFPRKGLEIHSQLIKLGFSEKHYVIGSALIDMYANCGALKEAQEVFDNLPARSIVPWSALLEGYSQIGNDGTVFVLFDKLAKEGIQPNDVTFMIVLNTCSHSGLLDKGYRYFESIDRDCNVSPTFGHFACIIDLCCRAGHLEEASVLINEMPFSTSLTLWHTVLSACRNSGNSNLAQWAFEHAAQMGEKNAIPFVCMNSILHGSSTL